MKTGKALPGRARRWLGGAVAFLFAVQACAASAADGGYHVTAGGGVELEGGVIASTAAKDGNSLSADHLTFSDIANRSEASSSSLGISLGAAPDGKPGLPMPEVGQPAREQSTGTARATLTPGSLNLAHQTQDLAHLDTALAEANTKATRYDLERLKAKQQSAAALSELLNKAVGDFSGKLRLPEGSPAKAALHAVSRTTEIIRSLHDRNPAASWRAIRHCQAAAA